MNCKNKIICLTVFAVAMAFVESAIVVYLRAIFHPEGFIFPLKTTTDHKVLVEAFRELATIVMLVSVAFLAGTKRWERFAYFMLSFGVWDIFYYVWLKVLLDWPASLFDWDILFLIPMPWIGPVIAPVSVSVLMIVVGILIVRINNGHDFNPPLLTLIPASSGVILILYSFMCDTGATLHCQMPAPYRYELLIIGNALLASAFGVAYRKSRKIA